MQKKQAKVFAGLLSMSLAVSLMTPLQGVSGQAARRKIALSKKSVTMTVGQKKTIRIKNAKGKRIKWSIKKKSIASYKKSGKYAVKLTAKKKGTTTLTCKVKNGKWKSYRCKVKVKKATLVRTPVATNDVVKTTEKPSPTAVVTMPSVPTQTPTDGQDKPQEPEKTPTVKPTATPTTVPTPTLSPTATPTAAPTVTPMPTVLTNNKIECGIKDNKLIVSLNFEEDDEVMYVAFRKGNELKKIVTPDIHNMTAEVDLSDTEYDSIDVYVWNGNMKPYAEVNKIEK